MPVSYWPAFGAHEGCNDHGDDCAGHGDGDVDGGAGIVVDDDEEDRT